MYIPSSVDGVPLELQSYGSISQFVTDDSGGGIAPAKWSSLIGIVTAICGNVLISFALNTQRYAHMRIERDREEIEEKQKQERRRDRKTVSYGTQQAEVAEERARTNLKSEPANYTLEEPQNSTETDPLIPSVNSLGSRRGSGSSEDTIRPDEEQKEKSYLKSPIWWLGIAMMVTGEAGNFLAYGFAPASIVSPLGVVALVSNCLIAPWLLHERFRWRDGVGVIIAIAGCVTVVMSANDSNPKLDPDAIWHLITRWEFATYFGITVVLILALCVASNKFGEKTILIDLGLMALFGGYTALSTKGVASLLSNTIWRVVTFPITYLLVAVLVFTAVMQIKYINRALQRFNATMVIPTQFVLFTISVIVGSAILFRDFDRTTTQDAIKFIGGCALTFLGVWFITSGRGDESEGDEELGEEEDAISLLDEEGVQPEIRERDDNVDRIQPLVAGSSKRAPQFKRYLTGGSTTAIAPKSGAHSPERDVEELSPFNRPLELSPANNAAIHEHSSAKIPHASSEPHLPIDKPPMHATTSTPVVPTTDMRPKTPLTRGQSVSAVPSPSKPAPSTPQRPPIAAHTESQRLLNRHSVAGLLPGPLTSPLSSSLSAIVADSLRRGVDHASPLSIRRRSFKQSRRKADAPPVKRHSIASGEMDISEEASADRPGGARVRSLSAAIGDIFGSGSNTRPRMESQETAPPETSRSREDDER